MIKVFSLVNSDIDEKFNFLFGFSLFLFFGLLLIFSLFVSAITNQVFAFVGSFLVFFFGIIFTILVIKTNKRKSINKKVDKLRKIIKRNIDDGFSMEEISEGMVEKYGKTLIKKVIRTMEVEENGT
jgi:hypothetical protein